VDMQDRILQSIPNKDYICWNTRRLIDAAKELNIETCYTEQSPDKLGPSNKFVSSRVQLKAFKKQTFSCISNQELITLLKSNSKKEIILVGIETHICIQQTAIDLAILGFNIHLCVDATDSRKQLDKEVALKKLSQIGIFITTVEAIMFEWCRTSQRKEFKTISNLAKESDFIY
tara:strand:+ start:1505 stop:2026 length:522 start_codon:yes stop_codon:yes gene_type:complete